MQYIALIFSTTLFFSRERERDGGVGRLNLYSSFFWTKLHKLHYSLGQILSVIILKIYNLELPLFAVDCNVNEGYYPMLFVAAFFDNDIVAFPVLIRQKPRTKNPCATP